MDKTLRMVSKLLFATRTHSLYQSSNAGRVFEPIAEWSL